MTRLAMQDSCILYILLFFYSGRIFWIPNFTQKCESFTPDKNFYIGTARGARDKYQVCNVLERYLMEVTLTIIGHQPQHH